MHCPALALLVSWATCRFDLAPWLRFQWLDLGHSCNHCMFWGHCSSGWISAFNPAAKPPPGLPLRSHDATSCGGCCARQSPSVFDTRTERHAHRPFVLAPFFDWGGRSKCTNWLWQFNPLGSCRCWVVRSAGCERCAELIQRSGLPHCQASEHGKLHLPSVGWLWIREAEAQCDCLSILVATKTWKNRPAGFPALDPALPPPIIPAMKRKGP